MMRYWRALWYRRTYTFAWDLYRCFRYRQRLVAEIDELRGALCRSVEPGHLRALQARLHDRYVEVHKLDSILPKR